MLLLLPPQHTIRTGICSRESKIFFSTPSLLVILLPTMEIIVWPLSTLMVPNFSSSDLIKVRLALLSMVTDTATSDVVIMSIGVLYCSNTSNTRRRNPYAMSIRDDLMLMAVMLSFAATALTTPSLPLLVMMVPGAFSSMVFLSLTVTLYFCAGTMVDG